MINEAKNVDSFEYNMETKKLDLYDNGVLVTSIDPLKIIHNRLDSNVRYLICNGEDIVCFNKIGQEINSIPVWSIIEMWKDIGMVESLYRKYLKDS